MILRMQLQDNSEHVFKTFLKNTELNRWSPNDLLFIFNLFLPVLAIPLCPFYRVIFAFVFYPFNKRI